MIRKISVLLFTAAYLFLAFFVPSPCSAQEASLEESAPALAEPVAEEPAPVAEEPAPQSEGSEEDVFELISPSTELHAPLAATEKPDASSEGLVSVSLDNVPVTDVVNMFSRISGANIIVAGTFTNLFVTANLKNVQWKAALNLVLGSVNLSMIEDPSGIIMVVTAEMYQEKLKQLEDTKPMVTRVFKPQYLNPVDLVTQIQQMKILSPRGSITTSQSKEQDIASLKSSETTVRPFAQSEKRQNPSITTAIIVTDIKEYVEKVAAIIEQLDKREPQVFIEARIIDIVTSDSSKVGFDWEMLDSFGVTANLEDLKWSWSDTREVSDSKENKYSLYDKRSSSDEYSKRYDIDGRQYEETTTTYEESPPGSGNWAANTVLTPTRSIGDSILTGRDVTSEYTDSVKNALTRGKTATALLDVSQVSLFLSALKRNGNAKTLSHPMMIVGNRVEAKIHVGDMTWQITLKKDVLQSGAAPRTDYSEEAKEVQLGLKLWVIPEIDEKNRIVRLTVNPEMIVFIENLVTAQGSVYPVTSTRTILTRVNVPSGDTLVIGGLIEHTKSKKEKKVPFLGDIPLIGLLFRHTEEVAEKHNLVVMLSPTILDDTTPVTGYESMTWGFIEDFEPTPLSKTSSDSSLDADKDQSEEVEADFTDEIAGAEEIKATIVSEE